MHAPGAIVAPHWLQLFSGHPRRDSGMTRPRGPHSEDHALTIRALAGDTDAFFALAERHQARMHSVVLRIVGDPHEAEDVVQDALLRGHAKLHTFRAEAGLATWLYRIAINLALRRARRRRAHRLQPEAVFESMDTDTADPATAAESRQSRETIYQAVQRLPDKQRICVLLRYFEHHSYDEMAEILDVSVGTVSSRLFHARGRLARLLEGQL
jgi:RNA polymerase sigma-70 factor (ECF subfamily)